MFAQLLTITAKGRECLRGVTPLAQSLYLFGLRERVDAERRVVISLRFAADGIRYSSRGSFYRAIRALECCGLVIRRCTTSTTTG